MPSTPSLGHILIVDDDENIAELLQINLRSEGYTVDSAPMAEKVDFDSLDNTQLIIVDAMHQPYSGMDLIYDLKDNPATEHVGIILYSNIKSERIVIDALDAGADDYIPKPIRMKVLMSRVAAILKRVAADGSLRIDRERHLIYLDGRPLPLPRKEFALLALLSSEPGRLFSREEIYARVWGTEVVVGDRTIDVHIRKLRQKIGERHITTVKGVGYRYEP